MQNAQGTGNGKYQMLGRVEFAVQILAFFELIQHKRKITVTEEGSDPVTFQQALQHFSVSDQFHTLIVTYVTF